MKNFSELHFSFEVPHTSESENTGYSTIFTSEKFKSKLDDEERTIKANERSDQNWHVDKYERSVNVIERNTDVIEKLRLIKTFLSPVVNEIMSSASNLTEAEIRRLQLNKSPLCKIPRKTFTAAIKASKLLKEVKAELYGESLLNFPQNTFIVNTLYYPDGDMKKEPIDFDKNIYVDKGLIKQLLELQKVLASIINELGLSSAGIEGTSSSVSHESTNKSGTISHHESTKESNVINRPAQPEIASNNTHPIPQSQSKEKKIKIKDPETAEMKEEMLRCLKELSDIRSSIIKAGLQKKLDFSDEIQLSGSPTVRDCCLKYDVPHLHAKLNGIPIIIMINKETMDNLLKTLNKNKNEKMKRKEENKRKKGEEKERKREEKQGKKGNKNSTKKDEEKEIADVIICSRDQKPNYTTPSYDVKTELPAPPSGEKKPHKLSIRDTREIGSNASLYQTNTKPETIDETLITTTFESAESFNNKINELGAFLGDDDGNDDDDVDDLDSVDDDDEKKRFSRFRLSAKSRLINRSISHLQILSDDDFIGDKKSSLSGSDDTKPGKDISNAKNTSTSELEEKAIKKFLDQSSQAGRAGNGSKKSDKGSIRSYHSVDIFDLPGKSLEDELIESFHDADDKKTKNLSHSILKHHETSFDVEKQSMGDETGCDEAGCDETVCDDYSEGKSLKNIMSKICTVPVPSRISLKRCCSQKRPKQLPLTCCAKYSKHNQTVICVRDDDISKESKTGLERNEKSQEYQVMPTTIFDKSSHQTRGFDRNAQIVPSNTSEKNKHFSVSRRNPKEYNFDVPFELLGSSAKTMLFDIRSNITEHFENMPLNIRSTQEKKVNTYVVTLETNDENGINNIRKTSVFKEQLIIEETNREDCKVFKDKSVSTSIEIPCNPNKLVHSEMNKLSLPKFVTHPYMDKFKEIGIENVIGTYEPAECCRKSFLNENPEPSMPYPPSLMSLPLDDSDLDEIDQTVTTNFWYEKLQYYVSLGRDDLRWPSHTYEIRYFVLTEEMEETPTKESKNNNTTEILYDSTWKYQTYDIRMFKDTKNCKKSCSSQGKHIKDPKSMPVKKAYQTPSETPYSPSAHSLPGVGLIAVPEMYRASRSSLPRSNSNIQMILPLTTRKSKKFCDDDTSLSPEHFAAYREDGHERLLKNTKNIQTSATFLRKKTIICTASQTPSGKLPCKNPSYCVQPSAENKNFEPETIESSYKCKHCSTSTKPNKLLDVKTICRSENSLKRQSCSTNTCKYKKSNNNVEISQKLSRESIKTGKRGKLGKSRSSSSFGSSKMHPEASCIEAKKSSSTEKSLAVKSSAARSATSVGNKSKMSKHKPSKHQWKLEEPKNNKSRSFSSFCGKKKTKGLPKNKSNRSVTLDESGSLKRNMSKAMADKNLPGNSKVFWALTKIHVFDDGSQELDILDITSIPPGHYMVSEKNNLVLMGQQPSKT